MTWTPETLCLGMAARGLTRLPAARQRWCVARYQGYTMDEHARQEGVTESRISQRVKAWAAVARHTASPQTQKGDPCRRHRRDS